MTPTITISAAQALQLETGRLVIVRPLNPQPDRQPFQVEGEKTGDWFTENPDYPRHGPMMKGRWKSPTGPIGTVAGMRSKSGHCWVIRHHARKTAMMVCLYTTVTADEWAASGMTAEAWRKKHDKEWAWIETWELEADHD